MNRAGAPGRMSLAELRTLPPAVNVETAAAALGV